MKRPAASQTVAFANVLPRIRARVRGISRKPVLSRDRVLATVVRLLEQVGEWLLINERPLHHPAPANSADVVRDAVSFTTIDRSGWQQYVDYANCFFRHDA